MNAFTTDILKQKALEWRAVCLGHFARIEEEVAITLGWIKAPLRLNRNPSRRTEQLINWLREHHPAEISILELLRDWHDKRQERNAIVHGRIATSAAAGESFELIMLEIEGGRPIFATKPYSLSEATGVERELKRLSQTLYAKLRVFRSENT